MTWGPEKDSIKKILETSVTAKDPKRVKSTELIKAGRVSVPFFKIQSPLFSKTEQDFKETPVSHDMVNLPSAVRSADFDLFSKEAQLTGWEVRKLSRTKAEVDAEGYTGHYIRRGKRWRLDRVTKLEPKLTPYDTPLTKLVEKNAIKDIEEIQDHVFMDYVSRAAEAMDDQEE